MGERVLGFAELYLDESQFGAHFDASYNADEKNFPMVRLFYLAVVVIFLIFVNNRRA